MKQAFKTGLLAAIVMAGMTSGAAVAQEAAMSEKHAQAATNFRQALYKLVYSNMGPFGRYGKR